jgi:hypothetical protein
LREKTINKSVDYKAENLTAVQTRMTTILVIYIGNIINFYFNLRKYLNFIFILAGFMLTWTPYAFVSLYSAFFNPDHITPLMTTIPAILAKTSMALSILFYIFTNKELKLKLRKQFVFSAESKQLNRNY